MRYGKPLFLRDVGIYCKFLLRFLGFDLYHHLVCRWCCAALPGSYSSLPCKGFLRDPLGPYVQEQPEARDHRGLARPDQTMTGGSHRVELTKASEREKQQICYICHVGWMDICREWARPDREASGWKHVVGRQGIEAVDRVKTIVSVHFLCFGRWPPNDAMSVTCFA